METPQLDKVQKHKGLKNAQPEMEHTLPPKVERAGAEKEVRRVKSQRWRRTIRQQCLLDTAGQGPYGFPVAATAHAGPMQA